MDKAKEFQKNICFIYYTTNFVCITTNWKILKDMGIPVSWETFIWVKKQELEPDIEQMTGSKLWKKYNKAIITLLYLTYMQNTPCKMLSWMNHKLESRLQGEIWTASYLGDTTLMAEREELKSLLRVKEESEKAGLKLNIQKTKIMVSSPITSWQIDGGKMETVTETMFLGSKITVDGDCSHESKKHLLHV